MNNLHLLKEQDIEEMNLELHPAICGRKIRRLPHGPNQRMHWALKARWTKAWQESVFDAWMYRKSLIDKPLKPFGKAEVTVFLYCVKLKDKDNAYGSVKPIIDALRDYTEAEKLKDCVRLGLIKSDDPEHLELKIEQIKVNHKRDEKVLINIKPL